MMKYAGAVLLIVCCDGLSAPRFASFQPRCGTRLRSTTTDEPGQTMSLGAVERLALKSKLFAAAAACDRGFAAFPGSVERAAADALVTQLSALNPTPEPTSGLEGSSDPSGPCLLEGNWKMVYTTAYDVLSLGASPLTALEGIYQDISASGDSVNVIDLCPRFQVALPLALSSTLRLKVLPNFLKREGALK